MSEFPSVRVATWNLDHASNSSRPVEKQIEKILDIAPDILVLTETCKEVDLSSHGYSQFTTCQNEYGKYYATIHLSPRVRESQKLLTYDDTVAVFVRAISPIGEILIYGTIITYHGDRGADNSSRPWVQHYRAIVDHGNDWARLLDESGGFPLIIAGDFNQTRDGSSGTYGTKQGREMLGSELSRNNLSCLTTEDFGLAGKLKIDPKKGWVRHNVDHICVTSDAFCPLSVGAWDHFDGSGAYLSDHNGVYVDLCPR